MRFVAKIQVFVYGTESVSMETLFVIIVTVVETRWKRVLVSKTAAQLQASTLRAEAWLHCLLLELPTEASTRRLPDPEAGSFE